MQLKKRGFELKKKGMNDEICLNLVNSGLDYANSVFNIDIWSVLRQKFGAKR